MLKAFWVIGGIAAIINLLCLPAFYMGGEPASLFVCIMAGVGQCYAIGQAWGEVFPKKSIHHTVGISPVIKISGTMPSHTKPSVAS